MPSTWYLYILRGADSRLYTGIATDVVRRFSEHAAQGRRCARSLRGRLPLELVFVAQVGTRSAAARTEARIRGLPRARKLRLITGQVSLEDA
ncbi:MAG: GIY-YIG nuclease family protein [Candidatus Latescibacterota bacterium]